MLICNCSSQYKGERGFNRVNNISFPKLGLEFTINRAAFYIGQKPIYWYAIIIMFGFFAGLLFVSRTCKKRGANPDNIFDIAFWGLIFGLICARIYYVAFDRDVIAESFWNIFKIWEGGIAIYGGITGAVITALVYCKIKKLPVLKYFDICSPGLLIGQAIGRWGNFVNCEVYGRQTDNIFQMSINGNAGVHPLFLYESVWNVIGFIIILLFRDKKKADGQVFLFYILWYSAGRLFMEGMRQKEYILWLIDGKLGISQAVAAICIILSTATFIIMTKKAKNDVQQQK